MAADIFVSFASKDVRVAMTLCAALENRGFSCWISARDIEPGANFQSAIVRALRQAKIMLLVFTANSNTSEEMTKELALASQNKMIVIPLRVEDVTPNDAFAYEFATRQWIDVFADWELAIEQLSRRIGQALLDRSSARAGAAADALKTVIASAAAAKLVDAESPTEDAEPVDAETTAALEAAPLAEAPVEAAVKALEALEASAEAQAGAAEAAAVLESAAAPEPVAAPEPAPAPVPELAADTGLPPAGEDELWPAAVEESAPTPPTAKAPVGLLIGGAVAVLAVVGIVIAVLTHGGSKAPSAEATTPQSTAAASTEAASAETPVSAAPPAVAAAAPAAASDLAQSSLAAAPAPKPVRHKKEQPKVDIPF